MSVKQRILSVYRCEGTTVVAKCEMLKKCSKDFIGIWPKLM